MGRLKQLETCWLPSTWAVLRSAAESLTSSGCHLKNKPLNTKNKLKNRTAGNHQRLRTQENSVLWVSLKIGPPPQTKKTVFTSVFFQNHHKKEGCHKNTFHPSLPFALGALSQQFSGAFVQVSSPGLGPRTPHQSSQLNLCAWFVWSYPSSGVTKGNRTILSWVAPSPERAKGGLPLGLIR